MFWQIANRYHRQWWACICACTISNQTRDFTVLYILWKKRILAASFIVHDRSVLKRALVESTHCLIHWITSALLAARNLNETAWTTFLHQKRLSGSLTSTFCENVCDNRNLFAVFITYKIKSMISYCYLSNMKDNLFYTLIMQYDILCIWSRCNFCFVFLQIKKISRI